ncbi:hypothetical protein, variant 2 [Aphanomyces invadans]|nr:hypothetical protein, variant 1 [Aphanomyces invadans]XP_008871952.1 hypothetical protein, variant 2 [Aphanomyces invadans]ETV99395.1 hypothetical protein, variant 1 [Aphanomyces invadans]ETV99396.1 hypothetical protein, variant 2 [Aphanomyces invadans]|eukprot:XP_008871951.1 hypothetical protein, variant 1 [Aphanomyces invadans]
MNAIASCKTDEYRKQMRGLYGANFVDGVCLHKLPTTKQNRPAYFYTALKWCVLQPPTKNGKGLGSDFCFLEYAGIHKETEVHEKMGFCIQQSVSMDKEVPDFAHYGLQRDTFQRTGLLVTATSRDHTVRLTSFCQIQNARLQPAHPRDLELMMFRRVAAVREFAMYLDRDRLGRMQFVERSRWIPDTDRRTCAVCLKMFLFRRKHHCRQCGEVVCNMCSPHREIDATNFGLTRVRICTVCMMRARCNHAISDDYCGSSVCTVNVDTSVVDYLQSPPLQSGRQRGWDDEDPEEVRDPVQQKSDYASLNFVSRHGYKQQPALAYDTVHRSKQAAAAAATTSTTPTFVRTPANLASTPRPVLEFDDDENAVSEFVLTPPPPQPDRIMNRRDFLPQAQLLTSRHQHLLTCPQPTPCSSQMQSQLALLPYPSSFNQASDLESTVSFQTNTTDDTECPYATHNYGKLMAEFQPQPESPQPTRQKRPMPPPFPSQQWMDSSMENPVHPPSNRRNTPSNAMMNPPTSRPAITPNNEHNNLSPLTHPIRDPNSARTAAVSAPHGTTIFHPRVVHGAPVTSLRLPSSHQPPALTDCMKASLSARQALLKARELARPPQQLTHSNARPTKVGGLSHQGQTHPPPQLEKQQNSTHPDHSYLVHQAMLAFARLNQRPASSQPFSPPTHTQMNGIERALDCLNVDIPQLPDRVQVLRSLELMLSSVIMDKDLSDCIRIDDQSRYRPLLTAYPSVENVLRSIGYTSPSASHAVLALEHLNLSVLNYALVAIKSHSGIPPLP